MGGAGAGRPPVNVRSDAGALFVHERGPVGHEVGTGPYVLVHGTMDRSTSFLRLAARLPEASVISYDRRGYARSSDRAASEAFADQVADLVEILDGRRVVAFGHSFGGDVVLATAEQYPALIAAAVVWEPPTPWLPEWLSTSAGAVLADEGDDADAAEAFMRRMVGERVWERLPAATRLARRREGTALVTEIRALRASAPFDPSAVAIPVIVGTGQASREHHRRFAAALAGSLPHAELVTVPGAGHGAHLSHPGEVADLLRRVAEPVGLGVAPAAAPSWTETSPRPTPPTDEESPA